MDPPVPASSSSNLNTIMSGGAIQLWCLIDRSSNPFKVVPQTGNDIYDLKKLIIDEKRHGALRSVDPSDLVLFKVRHTVCESSFNHCNYLLAA